MSDSEDASSEEEEIISLDEVQNKFAEEVGHKPHSVQQMLAYCKQNNIPHKFRDINKWWPSRPEPELKPVQKAVNADDYKDPRDGGDGDGSGSDEEVDDNKEEDKPKEDEPKEAADEEMPKKPKEEDNAEDNADENNEEQQEEDDDEEDEEEESEEEEEEDSDDS
eukprot:26349_1